MTGRFVYHPIAAPNTPVILCTLGIHPLRNRNYKASHFSGCCNITRYRSDNRGNVQNCRAGSGNQGKPGSSSFDQSFNPCSGPSSTLPVLLYLPSYPKMGFVDSLNVRLKGAQLSGVSRRATASRYKHFVSLSSSQQGTSSALHRSHNTRRGSALHRKR